MPDKFDFASAIKQLEDINQWFQEEDIDLDEGLTKLKQGKDIIKNCRQRLSQVENEFIKIKNEFSQETQENQVQEANDGHINQNDTSNENLENVEEVSKTDDIPF